MTLLDKLELFANYYVYFEGDKQKYNKHLERVGLGDYCVEGGIHGRFVVDYDTHDVYLWAEDEASAYHEILHATIRILRHIGVELSVESEEVYTYLFTHLVRKFRNKFKEK
jgi:hypothetical protein